MNGKIEKLPEKYLNKKELFKKTCQGVRLLHIAASLGQLEQIYQLPNNEGKEIVTKESLLLRDDLGKSVVAHLILSNNFKQLPKEFNTEKIVRELIDIAEGENNPPLLQCLAIQGNLHLLPKSMVTTSLLLTKDKDENTIIHWISKNGNPEEVPKNILTKETLLVKNKSKKTPLDYLASRRLLHKVPKEFLKENIIFPENGKGKGQTILNTIIEEAANKCSYGYFNLIIKNFSKKSLKAITKLYKGMPAEYYAEQILKEKAIIESLKENRFEDL